MPTLAPWAPTQNTFEINTRNNFTSASLINNRLYDRLNTAKADPDILVLFNYYTPIHNAYKAIFDNIDTMMNLQIGATAALNNVFDAATAAVNLWDAKIAATTGFAVGSAAYIALFPHGHSPFISGKQADRVAAVQALSTALVGVAALATTKVLVDAYLLQLNNANNAQKAAIANVATNSVNVETQRLLMCQGQYSCLGGLMQKYAATPDTIANFFYVELLRSNLQIDFNHSVKLNSKQLIVHRTLEDSQNIRFKNNGTVPLNFYFADTKDGNHVGTVITVQAGGDIHHLKSDFNCPASTFMYAQNLNTLADGHYEVVLG